MNKFPILLALFVTCSACQQRSLWREELSRYRQEKSKENTEGERAPLRPADISFVDFFKPQFRYRVEASFLPAADTSEFNMLTYSGLTRKYARYGTLDFTLKGRRMRLTLYQNKTLIAQEAYRNHLFLPFKDVSNGESTYGGGRYLDLSTTDLQHGKMVLDFNKAYNPWCAYSDGYNCPVPPAENHLEMAILAGEKNYRGTKKQKNNSN